MAIPPDPNNTLETLATFPIPMDAGATPSPNARTVVACAKIPVLTGGSGTQFWQMSLAKVGELLSAFETLVNSLPYDQQLKIAQSLNISPPFTVQADIELAIRYLTYLGTRDELLQQAIAGLMSRTK